MTTHHYTIRLPHISNLGHNYVADQRAAADHPDSDTGPHGFHVYDRARGLYLFRITAAGVQWTPNVALARIYHRPYTAAVVAGRYAHVPAYSVASTRPPRICSYSRNTDRNTPTNRPLAEWLNIGMVINREEYTA